MGNHKNKKHKRKRRCSSSSSDSLDNIKLMKHTRSTESNETDCSQVFIGPVIPSTSNEVNDFGSASISASKNISYGPKLPDHLVRPQISSGEDTDECVIGPLPADAQLNSAHMQLEIRALEMKTKFLNQDNEKEDTHIRETWMTELPPEKANHFGMGPRKFRMSAKTGDSKNRSLWTETPHTKKNKEEESPEDSYNRLQSAAIVERDRLIDEAVKKSKRKKGKKSLLDIHNENLKKKKKEKKNKHAERRPFDRDVDMKVNRFDDAVKRSIIKKAQLLDTRFSQGQSKYL